MHYEGAGHNRYHDGFVRPGTWLDIDMEVGARLEKDSKLILPSARDKLMRMKITPKKEAGE